MSDLKEAIMSGDLVRVKALLPPRILRWVRNGVDVNERDEYGNTPLIHAIQANDVRMTKLLLARGADVKAVGQLGDPPLHEAAREGNCVIVKLLLSNGAKVGDLGGRLALSTALHGAAYCGQAAVVKLLLSKGANVEARKIVPIDGDISPASDYTLSKIPGWDGATGPGDTPLISAVVGVDDLLRRPPKEHDELLTTSDQLQSISWNAKGRDFQNVPKETKAEKWMR